MYSRYPMNYNVWNKIHQSINHKKKRTSLLSHLIICEVSTSHTLHVLSPEAESTRRESGLKLTYKRQCNKLKSILSTARIIWSLLTTTSQDQRRLFQYQKVNTLLQKSLDCYFEFWCHNQTMVSYLSAYGIEQHYWSP